MKKLIACESLGYVPKHRYRNGNMKGYPMSYQRYMKGMSNGGMIASHDRETPLTNSELAAVVPSLFATEAHESRSDRFVPIPTVSVLDALRAADFQPFFAQQARTRVLGKGDFTRHMVRMRHKSLTNSEGRAFEVILTNANDGTSAYKMIAGIFRFVCTNGLFTGESFSPVHVRHSGKEVIAQVQAGALNILNLAPEAMALIDEMKGVSVDRSEALQYAQAAHLARFPRAYAEDESGALMLDETSVAVNPLDLLRSRRSADRHATAWHMFNIVQENAIRGGQRGQVVGSNGKVRNSCTRPVNSIPESEKLNGFLWDMAVAFTKSKRG